MENNNYHKTGSEKLYLSFETWGHSLNELDMEETTNEFFKRVTTKNKQVKYRLKF